MTTSRKKSKLYNTRKYLAFSIIQNTKNVFFLPAKKPSVSSIGRKIILLLFSKKTQSQKLIKHLNILLKYTTRLGYAAKPF